jgi:hypothetical protein
MEGAAASTARIPIDISHKCPFMSGAPDLAVASVLRLRMSWSAGSVSFSKPIDGSFGWRAV